MDCPYCGFDPAQTPCPLCGEDAANPDLYQRPAPRQYRMTLILSPLSGNDGLTERLTSLAVSAASEPPGGSGRRFFLFPLENVEDFLQAAAETARLPGIELRFNGQPYPYAHELWLPLLRFLELR